MPVKLGGLLEGEVESQRLKTQRLFLNILYSAQKGALRIKFTIAPKSRTTAFTDAARLLRDECTAVNDGATYLQARCDGDVVELLLRDDVATFRVAALQKGITPPWCIEKNCINGSMGQRKRILKLGERLGWSPIDSMNLADEGRWTPIFFNTDAVPRDE